MSWTAKGELRQWARLCAVFFLTGLIASRLTLVLHELVGHGGMAALMGSRMVGYRLFLFGGGWVTYEWGPEKSAAASIAVSLTGIALELAVAAVALVLARSVQANVGDVGSRVAGRRESTRAPPSGPSARDSAVASPAEGNPLGRRLRALG